jgi:hypothetical protein
VTQVFYVCFNFNATAEKGVYVTCDQNVARSHSRTGLPDDTVCAVSGKFDWMIRAHLVPVTAK